MERPKQTDAVLPDPRDTERDRRPFEVVREPRIAEEEIDAEEWFELYYPYDELHLGS